MANFNVLDMMWETVEVAESYLTMWDEFFRDYLKDADDKAPYCCSSPGFKKYSIDKPVMTKAAYLYECWVEYFTNGAEILAESLLMGLDVDSEDEVDDILDAEDAAQYFTFEAFLEEVKGIFEFDVKSSDADITLETVHQASIEDGFEEFEDYDMDEKLK